MHRSGNQTKKVKFYQGLVTKTIRGAHRVEWKGSGMSFMPAMTWRTEGISVRAPVKWRAFDGMMGAFWEAECHGGATGHYLAEDPRIMIFFDNVSDIITLSNSSAGDTTCFRPMQRAHYIPAGMPMWTRTETLHAFAHLNLHIHKDRLLRFLTQSIGRSAALEAMRRPVETQDVDAIEPLARLVVDELALRRHHLWSTWTSAIGPIATR